MRKRRLSLLAAFATAALVFPGCNSDDPAKPAIDKAPTKTDPAKVIPAKTDPAKGGKPKGGTLSGKKYSVADKKAAKAQFKSFCSTCHGLTGKGDGAAAVALVPKPRNWTDAEWQKSTTDAKIFKVIKEGGITSGLSPLMVPNPDYQERPGVIHALVDLVRRFNPEK
jgi:mono/diheme cytochrome c family protein